MCFHAPPPPQHGRVKVRSPAEQEERKRREREAKVQLYRKLTQQIYAKVALASLPSTAFSWLPPPPPPSALRESRTARPWC